MIKNSKNKANASPTSVSVDNPGVTSTIPSHDVYEFHFSGDGIYFPMVIKSSNQAAALIIWLKKRVPYEK